jgi:hypothetical protein
MLRILGQAKMLCDDVVATIYHLLGIDPHMTVPDRAGRPIAIAHGGSPIADIIG